MEMTCKSGAVLQSIVTQLSLDGPDTGIPGRVSDLIGAVALARRRI